MKREVTEHLSQCPLRLRGPLQVSWVPLSVSLRSSRVTARQRCCFGNLYGLPEWWAGAGLHWVTSQRRLLTSESLQLSTSFFRFSSEVLSPARPPSRKGWLCSAFLPRCFWYAARTACLQGTLWNRGLFFLGTSFPSYPVPSRVSSSALKPPAPP